MLSGKPETGPVGPSRAGAAHDASAIAQANGTIERFAPVGAAPTPCAVDRKFVKDTPNCDQEPVGDVRFSPAPGNLRTRVSTCSPRGALRQHNRSADDPLHCRLLLCLLVRKLYNRVRMHTSNIV